MLVSPRSTPRRPSGTAQSLQNVVSASQQRDPVTYTALPRTAAPYSSYPDPRKSGEKRVTLAQNRVQGYTSNSTSQYCLHEATVPNSLPLIIDGVVNKTYNAKILADTDCTVMGIICRKFSRKHQLPRTQINPLPLASYSDRAPEDVDTVVRVLIDIGGIPSEVSL